MNIISKDNVSGIFRFTQEEMKILRESMICAREELCVKKGFDNGLFEIYRQFSDLIDIFEPAKERKDDILAKIHREKLEYQIQRRKFFQDCIKSLLEKEGKKND